MNKTQLKKSLHHRVRIRPVAKSEDVYGRECPTQDDDWIIREVTETTVTLYNTRTHHTPILGCDHIYGYATDPQRNKGELKFGFLTLLVQLTLKGNEVLTEPLVGHAARR
jgi:hypothetical protein